MNSGGESAVPAAESCSSPMHFAAARTVYDRGLTMRTLFGTPGGPAAVDA
jgi:hypothetical protein